MEELLNIIPEVRHLYLVDVGSTSDQKSLSSAKISNTAARTCGDRSVEMGWLQKSRLVR